jgi:phospholipase/lecithinase/hemolysin
MHPFKFVLAVLVSVILASCGGGGSDLPTKPQFAAQVTFGDSLSDIGSYRVSTLESLLSGLGLGTNLGQFSINAAPGIPVNWTELTAASLGLPAPCAAATGGFGTARNFHPGCFGYAQGGARVTDGAAVATGGVFTGAMLEPVVVQIANHLAASGNGFSGNELVLVMAGANDVFAQTDSVGSGFPAASAVAAVQTAASELAVAVKTQIIAKGARFVVVANVPYIAGTPRITSMADPVARAAAADLAETLVTAFNTQLAAELPESANVLNVDAYAVSKDQILNPARFLLTNVTDTACDLTTPFPNPLGSSLLCNASNLKPGLSPEVHYLFADNIHPTPYGHSLFAQSVMQAMTVKGWF